MSDNPYQAPQYVPQTSPATGRGALENYRSQPVLSAATQLLIGLVLVARCATLAFDAWALRLLETEGLNDPDMQVRFDLVSGAVVLGQAGAYVLSIVVFFVWLSCAYRNLRALHSNRSEFGRVMAIGGFFIPFANLVLGYLIVKELRLGSRLVDKYQGRSKHSGLVLAWWLLHLIGGAVVQVAAAMANTARSPEDVSAAVVLEMVGLVLSIVPGVLLLKIVRDVDRGGEELYAYLATQPPPPEPLVQPAADFGKLEFPKNWDQSGNV